AEKPLVEQLQPFQYHFVLIFSLKRMFCKEENLFGVSSVSDYMEKEKVMQLIRSYYVLRFLCNPALFIRRQQFGSYRCVKNPVKNLSRSLIDNIVRSPFNKISHK